MTNQPTAIYVRVSTDDQDCERQVRDLTAHAERCGYQVIAVHKETASGTKNDRKERAKVLKLARERKIKFVLVTELTRWGRSLADLLTTLEELRGYGVSIVAQTGLEFDLSTPAGRMLAGVLGALSEFERDLLRERTKSGIAAARARGSKIGRQPGQVIRPHPLTDTILTMTAQGVSQRTIASHLKISKTTVMTVITKNRAPV